MKTIEISRLVPFTSSSEHGEVLFQQLQQAFEKNEEVLLIVENYQVLTPPFLNTSIGRYIELFGYNNFRDMIRFKGSRTQFQKIQSYIAKYRESYLAND